MARIYAHKRTPIRSPIRPTFGMSGNLHPGRWSDRAAMSTVSANRTVSDGGGRSTCPHTWVARIQHVANYVRCCLVCDLPVPEQSGAGRPAVYCSRRCRSAAERDRMARRLVLGQMVEQRMRRGQPDE